VKGGIMPVVFPGDQNFNNKNQEFFEEVVESALTKKELDMDADIEAYVRFEGPLHMIWIVKIVHPNLVFEVTNKKPDDIKNI
jgi:hypothetical protein